MELSSLIMMITLGKNLDCLSQWQPISADMQIFCPTTIRFELVLEGSIRNSSCYYFNAAKNMIKDE